MTNSEGKIIDFTKGEKGLAKRRWLRFIGLTITELIIITFIVLPFLNVVSAQPALSRSPEPNLRLSNLAGPGYQNDTSQVNIRGDDDGKDHGRDDGGDDGDGGGNDDGKDRGRDDGGDDGGGNDDGKDHGRDDGGDNGGGNSNENTPQPSSPDSGSTDNDDESSNTATPRIVRGLLVLGNPGPASDRGVTPVFVPGNPQGGSPQSNCGFFNPNYREFRIANLDIVGGGHYSDGFLSLDIVVTLSPTDGPSFAWNIAADSVVTALPGVFVKGGDNGNWYDYSGFTDVPEGGATFDGTLHSPVNPTNGKFFGLSHVSFCYHLPSQGANQGTNTGTNAGNNNSFNGTNEGSPRIFSAWVPGDSVVNEATDDTTPAFLPKTGVEQFWSSSFIAVALIIGGLNLTVVGLHSYLLLTHPGLYDQKKEDIEANK